MFRLTSITAPSLSLAYLYFPNGNLSRITDGTATDFTYDPLDRPKTAAGEYSASFNYDQIGNITGKTEGGTAHTYDYASSGHKHAPRLVDGNQQTYDTNGNLIARSGLSLKYDAENRLVRVTKAAGYVARFIYDGEGKRVKRVDNAGTVICIGPHYERNVGTGADTSDTVTKMYWAQLGAIRRLIAVRTDLTYLHHDHLGSTKKLSTDSTSFKYYPYGTTFQEPASPPTDNLYTGEKSDLSTGLYFYGARYYDSAIGRFVQPDSMIPSAGNPQDLNRYAYARNNPLAYVDPTGHFPWIVATAAVGAAVGGLIAYGAQVAGNINEHGLTVQAFTDVNWAAVGGGVVAGGVGAATFGASLALAGAATGMSVGSASAGSVGLSMAAGVASTPTPTVATPQATRWDGAPRSGMPPATPAGRMTSGDVSSRKKSG